MPRGSHGIIARHPGHHLDARARWGTQVSSTISGLESLDAKGELEDAFKGSSSCTELVANGGWGEGSPGEDGSRSPELMAIPIVVWVALISRHRVRALHRVGGRASGPGSSSAPGPVGVIVADAHRALYEAQPASRRRRRRHRRTLLVRLVQPQVDDVYRVLVIADASCVDPAFLIRARQATPPVVTLEALVIAPAIGSRLSRWTGDESQFVDARRHLDETVAALACRGVKAIRRDRRRRSSPGSRRRATGVWCGTRSSSSPSQVPTRTGSSRASSTRRRAAIRCPSPTLRFPPA